MASYKVKIRNAGAHVDVTVFVGPDLAHLANAGTLTFAEGPEADTFIDAIIGSQIAVVEYADSLVSAVMDTMEGER